jgi:mRNA deadenylase 3'-5' endonuclease subunit Ccr4
MSKYFDKYQKYKSKYYELKNQTGGTFKLTDESTILKELKIMSWNILADAPLWKKDYDSMKKENFIFWDYRKKLILDLINTHQPDICLLCEVEYDKILFFSQYCNDNNYGYIYTSSDPPKSTKSLEKYKDYTSSKNPGIMIMFKIDKLKLVNNVALDYSNYFINQQKEHGWSKEELNSRLRQCASNIVLFEKLDDSANRFYFTGLHHPFVKENEEIQEKQIDFLLNQVGMLNKNYELPVIIAGDFNSKPPSKVYEIMNSKGFNSVYKIANGVENAYTTTNSFTNQRMTLDYIFVNDRCRVINVNPIDSDYLERVNIPNENFPRDHMYLITNIVI